MKFTIFVNDNRYREYVPVEIETSVEPKIGEIHNSQVVTGHSTADDPLGYFGKIVRIKSGHGLGYRIPPRVV